jgi:glycosyltransferase involved in cell wall biosynthesis
MKIAIVGTRGIDVTYSGIERSVNEVSRRLAEKGHKVVVYCRNPKNRKFPARSFQNIKLVYIPTLHSKHFETFIHAFFSTFHILFSDVDIVHFHALGPSIFSFLPRLFGKKTLVSVHGLDWKRKKWKYAARLFLKLCEYPAIYFPNKTIVVSKTIKNYFEGKFNKKVYYIPNGIDVCCEGRNIKENVNKTAYILFVGRLVPEKGIHYLIKAFNELNTGIKLLIAGESSFTDEYVSYLHSISGPHIEFLGFIEPETLKELYRNAYIFVLPSEVEGSSFSLLEAMSHGKCVLVSDIPECLEVIGDCGISFRSSDYLDLKDKLRYLINSPDLVSQIGSRAKKRICEQYAWKPIIDELERLYSFLLIKYRNGKN